ncbi:ABC transporter substrate-binding protein [Cryobacterium sp. TMT1-21]|uniref:ABC transporter substrate-binding protein n=1 Tax=Cryobacterium shii TaxID=1259235 RepID=A0AAQ2HH12_9MICO|nr:MULTISPECIES: ABC transporter substrate-binding protein [Cryobacterium]TFC53145.1 ABC transporter substrate-binding protein [Cryobacterium shii]TFC87698.1 ABC transporter substrate-binding protein [Cryobacterium sp. TmT2-59]TFD10108.1 ABC transporter substrate-binding protein [Cryobacterium sp. TMT1-21]TFD20708.1 ABC transporter substrate-binding protein [Cryobacterium sp. TMT2-23]TFD22051.1 ABC transporter substrate-binding protein [Cryobacterium sp. TMT4-10]
MRARYTLPALAAVAALLLTGCVDNSTPATSGSSGKADSSVTKDAAAEAMLPDAVRASGKLVIGTSPNYSPNEFKDDSGNPIGWDIELGSALAAKLGLTAAYKVANFDTIIPSIIGGKMDLGISSFTDNLKREEQVDFVNYYTAGIQWASATGKTVDPDDACGLKIAVQTTTYEDTDEIPAKSDACVAAGKPPIDKLKFDTQDSATNATVLGQADAFSADSPVTLYAISKTEGKLQTAGTSFEEAPYGMAVAKGSKLTPAVQAALQSMVDDGSYGKILDKWGVAAGGLTTITINAAANG